MRLSEVVPPASWTIVMASGVVAIDLYTVHLLVLSMITLGFAAAVWLPPIAAREAFDASRADEVYPPNRPAIGASRQWPRRRFASMSDLPRWTAARCVRPSP